MENKIINPSEREIQVRVSKVLRDGVELLIYKDSRFDVNTLNDLYGIDGWNLKLETVEWNKGQTVSATITVRGKENAICTRNDFGEDTSGSIKALASDALKRAAFRLGIGTALYTGPKIFVSSDKVNFSPSQDGGIRCNDDFVVDEIVYSEDGKRIEKIIISNDTTNQVVFVWSIEEQEKRKEKRLAEFKAVGSIPIYAKTEKKEPIKEVTAEKPAKITREKQAEVSTPVVVKKAATTATKTPKAPSPTPPTPAVVLPPLNGPEDALNALATSGNKAGQPLRVHRPVELAFLFGGADTPIEIKNAIKQIAAATPSVKAACIKRGYGEIAS